MKLQWKLIWALIFAILIAIFAVINVSPVPINYLFGNAQIPLILLILGSTLIGSFIALLVSLPLQFRLKKQISQLKQQLSETQANQTVPPIDQSPNTSDQVVD